VLLSVDNPVASGPASVIVPEGSTVSDQFAIATKAVSAPTAVMLTATYNGVSKQGVLTVMPATLSALTIRATSVIGSTAAAATVYLTGVAPAEGANVQLTSSDPVVTVPASVTVQAGQSLSLNFTVATAPVAVPKTVTVTATYHGTTKTDMLIVNPDTHRVRFLEDFSREQIFKRTPACSSVRDSFSGEG